MQKDDGAVPAPGLVTIPLRFFGRRGGLGYRSLVPKSKVPW